MANPEDKNIYQLDIPAQLDAAAAVKRLKTVRMDARLEAMVLELAETVKNIARPQGIYRLAHACAIDGAAVDIEGTVFTSRVLNKLLNGRDTVIPFIVTIGKELDELAVALGDMMKSFYLDNIKTFLLVNAVNYLKEYVKEKHDMPRAALMNPGEIEDWRIGEQRPLFRLFPDAEKRIGVTLTAGGVMHPIKSRSGIVFPNESGFETCLLCTQLKCPGRRAKYDPELQKQYLA